MAPTSAMPAVASRGSSSPWGSGAVSVCRSAGMCSNRRLDLRTVRQSALKTVLHSRLRLFQLHVRGTSVPKMLKCWGGHRWCAQCTEWLEAEQADCTSHQDGAEGPSGRGVTRQR